MNKYIILDGEMGGIGMDKSLLTMYFMVMDDQGNKVDELDLALKPKDEIYKVKARALSINNINLIEHDKIAITYDVGGTLLYDFIKKNSDNGTNKLVPIGHGFSGDLDHIFDKLLRRPNWENFISYLRLDTQVVVQFLKETGHISESVSGGLDSLVEYFGITKTGQLHSAKTDVEMIWAVFNKLKDMLITPTHQLM